MSKSFHVRNQGVSAMDKVGSFWKGALAGAAVLLSIHAS